MKASSESGLCAMLIVRTPFAAVVIWSFEVLVESKTATV
jgi:hypothetical protein